jgi:hypothetical protein
MAGGSKAATVSEHPLAICAAIQTHSPGYTETGAIANGFALAHALRDATNARSELGALYRNAVLALRGRVGRLPPFSCSRKHAAYAGS